MGKAMGNAQTGVAGSAPAALDRYREMVQRELRETFPPSDLALYRMLRYHLGWVDQDDRPTAQGGGKGLRPTLCILACEMAGGKATAALPCAAALELVHSFSLIHDDVQDGDTERHHRPTVWVVWGQAQAIGAGNAMRALADRAVLRLAERGVDLSTALEASAALTTRCLEMIEGQYLDLALEETTEVTVEGYLDLVGRKTGALIDAAMHLGALVATADGSLATSLGRCGRLLGMAFQVQDDILGIWGDAQATGKPTGADIRRRKKSFPAVHALQHARGRDGKALHSIYGRQGPTEEDVEIVLGIMERLGTRGQSQDLAHTLYRQAMRCLDRLTLASGPLREFQEVASFLVTRQY